MPEQLGAAMSLVYGSALIWGAFQVTRLLSGLVRPARPPVFSYLHRTAVWSVGASTTVIGLAMVAYALTLVNGAG